MLLLRKPNLEFVRQFLAAQSVFDFTYPEVGATATAAPPGYILDHTRIKLGEGEAVFLSAKQALEHWEQFNIGWVSAVPPDTPLQPGQTVGVLATVLGVWWLNACRIIHLIDEPAPRRRFGFAYGTLPEHVGSGEECFLITWDQNDNSVWYEIVAFSRPRQWLMRLGYPFARTRQKRFGRDSAAAMLRKVKGS
ncbi:DUF1990 family protein [Planctomicrobium piriforme]|uniref:Uncharacterized protein, UPF0548 family n=1 Tax=Planctomicrobium piriforme TaxID=1576369 RepID=A0A1I3RL15_9PLAN|nr:DUF1990 domain-containing protein [Planctomicrobium piriforme]SFJ47283.1 Uncharacterized protein, UPF0548 family [Planctomicrobium piriforme]